MAKRKEEINSPKTEKIQTDMVFLELVNKRLDFLKAYRSEKHYKDHVSLGKKWINEWNKLLCSEITDEMIYKYLSRRSKVSHYTANKDLRNLRALFNFAVKRSAKKMPSRHF